MCRKNRKNRNNKNNKKYFIYLAFGENDQVLLHKDGEPVMSLRTLEGNDIKWGDKLRGYPKEKVKIIEEYREVSWDKEDKKCYRKLRNKAMKLISNKNIEKIKINSLKENEDRECNIEKKETEVIVKTDRENDNFEKQEKGLVNIDILNDWYIKITNLIQDLEKKIINKSENDMDLMVDNFEKIDNQLKNNQLKDDQAKDDFEKLERLKRDLKNISRNVDMVKNIIMERTNESVQETMNSYIDKITKEIKSNQKALLLKQKSIDEELEELRNSTQTIEGKLLKQLDEINTKLTSEDTKIIRELPSSCKEEKDITDLVIYSNRISEQLGYAAKDLIRKSAVFENQEQGRANEQKIAEQKEKQAFDDGKLEEKLFIIKQLLSKYTDIDVIINTENNHLHCVWTFLKEIGVEIDGDGQYKKGNELDLKEADMERMLAKYKGIDGAGKYRVIKTGLKFKEEVVFTAEFEKITEEPTNEVEKK